LAVLQFTCLNKNLQLYFGENLMSQTLSAAEKRAATIAAKKQAAAEAAEAAAIAAAEAKAEATEDAQEADQQDDNHEYGLELSDIVSVGHIEVKKVNARQGTLDKRQVPILDVEALEGDLEGQKFSYGFITQGALDCLRKNGRKGEDGEIILKVPTPNPEKQVQWINMAWM
jgi:hypothetical protein